MSTLRHTIVPSPAGPLLLVADEQERLVRVHFGGDPAGTPRGEGGVLEAAAQQLGEYFAGRRRVFDLPTHARGTALQERVWAALTRIPYGSTTTYGALAAQLGLVPRAARAVGAANGRNPLAIVVPCHRVIGADGRLTGYAGGLDAKRVLLEHEMHAATR